MSFRELRICFVFSYNYKRKTMQESSSALFFITGATRCKKEEFKQQNDVKMQQLRGDHTRRMRKNNK